MNRLGTGLAVAALMLVSACGSESGDPQIAATTDAPKIQLADACPKIQDALDQAFEGNNGIDGAEDFRGFADAMRTLQNQVDPKGKSLIETLTNNSITVAVAYDANATGGDLLDPRDAWLDTMKNVSDTCQQLGAPLK